MLFDFVLPGEVFEPKETEGSERLTIRCRRLSSGFIKDDLAEESQSGYVSMEILSENTALSTCAVHEKEDESPTQAEKDENESEPVTRRIDNTAKEYVENTLYLGIYKELALTLENEVQRALLKVKRNTKKAFQILGISSM